MHRQASEKLANEQKELEPRDAIVAYVIYTVMLSLAQVRGADGRCT
jgi:hypothetical protein